MQRFTRAVVLASGVLAALAGITAQANILFQDPTSLMNISFSGMFRPEMFAWINATLLDKDNPNDRFWLIRHTCDLALDLTDKDIITEFKFVLRNKGVWGNPGTIARTIPKSIKVVDSPLVPQSFSIPRYIFWMREAWLRFDLGKLFSLPFETSQFLTLGAFPFSLGRGIALGDAYAVGPELLGFYSDTVVDQYAFGFLFAGDVFKDALDYSFYGALLQNKSDSFGSNSEKTRSQQYGRRDTPSRGVGIVNYLFAGCMNWYPIKNAKHGSLRLQPYWLYNADGEQEVEFIADASSQFGTLGLEMEYLGDRVEVGIEGAFNCGIQHVRGWDRNIVELKSVDGRISQVNSHVVDHVDGQQSGAPGSQIPFVLKDPAQKAIFTAPQTEQDNGKQIPGDYTQIGYLFPPEGAIFNASDRFRDPYCNIFKGWMLVSDASVWVYGKDLKVAITAAVASGDDNPNFDTKDGDYSGFVPVQSIYSGKRVKSAFLLGGQGKVVRPIANPTQEDQTTNSITETVDGFTNLIFGGIALTWTPTDWEKPLKINPNCLFYWQYKTVPRSPLQMHVTDKCLANNFLGVELNLFADYNVVKNLKVYMVSSVFIPGQFYQDIRGRRDVLVDLAELDLADFSGYVEDDVPKFGSDVAITFNFGIDYRF